MNPDSTQNRFHGGFAEWLKRLPTAEGKRFITAFAHGTLSVELYAPRGVDPQMPHTRDEVYIVVQGEGFFVNGPVRHPFGPGDLLFVAAGVEHRFEEFSDDLGVWVIFYGPEGGEIVNPENT
jgi:mannose-6-phosphate isomerase-like protein (cupin superfamily)